MSLTTELAHSFSKTIVYIVLVSVPVLMTFSTIFHSINSPDNSLLSHSVLLSALMVLSAISLCESLPQP